MLEVRPGYFLLTRNTEEVGNNSPGFWNHVAIVGHDNWVIEAQQEPNSVIKVPGQFFWERYPEILVLKPRGDIGDSIAKAAESLIGVRYRKIASIFNFMRRSERGENCVSVARKAYLLATHCDPKWRIPDDLESSRYLTKVFKKEDYENWEKPDEWFKGMG